MKMTVDVKFLSRKKKIKKTPWGDSLPVSKNNFVFWESIGKEN